MPTPQRDPLMRYLTVQSAADQELRQVLRLAARQSARFIEQHPPGVGGEVRAAQLALVLSQMRRIQTHLWGNQVVAILEKYFPRVRQAAEKSADVLDEVLRTNVGERRAEAYMRSLSASAGAALQRDAIRTPQRLSQLVYKNADLASGRIERQIRASIIQGASAKELARAVRDYIRPDVKGGVSYAAMRLARTELNNAFHTEQIQQAQNKPWVSSVVWNLSRSHPREDRCDELTAGHSEGMTAGHYQPTEVPEKPHPQCLCYLTYDTVSEEDMVALMRAKLGKDGQADSSGSQAS